MQQPIHYLKLIRQLEDEKLAILNKYGQIEAVKLWPPIDEKLTRLYRWYAHDYAKGLVRPKTNFRVIKNGSLE